MTLDEAANRVSWRAANAIEPMEVSYVLTVSDGRLSGTYPNTVTVLPVNDAPAVRFENCAGSADEDELYTCDVLPMDIDGDDVVITLLDGPAGMVFEDDTISWQVPNVLEQETQTFTLLLGIVAAISMLVGGIGIMNIMLVSVSERTREIGLRKAVGAARRAILSQFLIESAVLSTLGGVIGILLGVSVSLVLSKFAGWAAVVTAQSILLAFVFSAGVGVLFGFWPARKASLLSPIEALRYE